MEVGHRSYRLECPLERKVDSNPVTLTTKCQNPPDCRWIVGYPWISQDSYPLITTYQPLHLPSSLLSSKLRRKLLRVFGSSAASVREKSSHKVLKQKSLKCLWTNGCLSMSMDVYVLFMNVCLWLFKSFHVCDVDDQGFSCTARCSPPLCCHMSQSK